MQIRQENGVCFASIVGCFSQMPVPLQFLAVGRTQDDELDEAMQRQQLSTHSEKYVETECGLPGNEAIISHALLGS